MTDEDEAKVRAKIESAEMEYPVALVEGAVDRAYRVTAVPKSYLIDRQGRVVWYGHPAALHEEQIEALLE